MDATSPSGAEEKRIRSRRILLSAFLSLLFLFCVQFFWGITFDGNDETGLMLAAQSNTNWEYSGNLLRILLSGLYRLFPHVAWYVVGMLFVLFVCFGVMIFCLLEAAGDQIGSVIALVPLTLLLVSRFTCHLSFTVTGLFCCAAAAVLLPGSKDRPGRFALSLGLLFLGALIRTSTFRATAPFYALAALWEFRRILEKKNIRRWCVVALVFAACLASERLNGSLIRGDETAATTPLREEDQILNKKLRQFRDYPHVSYEEAPELYRSIGWDPELLAMVDQWYFLDKRITDEALTKILAAEVPATHGPVEDAEEENADGESALGALLSLDRARHYKAFLLTDLLMGAALFIALLRGEKKWFPLLWCAAVGAVLLGEVWYLRHIGRLIDRSFYCAVLTPFLLCAVLWLRQPGGKARAIFPALLCAAAIFLFHGTIFDFEEHNEEKYRNIAITEAELFCREHPDCLFIYDYGVVHDTRLDSGLLVPATGEENRLFWGGTGYKSGGWYAMIGRFGYEEFTTDNLFDDKVYLLSGEKELEGSELWAYLTSVESGATYELAAQCPAGLYIYRFGR